MASDTDFGPLDSIPGQLEEIRDRLTAREKHVDDRFRAIETMVGENTVLTRTTAGKVDSAVAQLTEAAGTLKDIRDAQVAGRVAKKVIAWGGGIAGGAAGMWTAWQAFFKH
jgi:hypothetical protein